MTLLYLDYAMALSSLHHIMFNSGFSAPLSILHDHLVEEGVVLRIRLFDGIYWHVDDDPSGASKDPVDATFVALESSVIWTTSPTVWGAVINKLLRVVFEVYGLAHLELGFKFGKMEAIVMFRWKMAKACRK